MTENAALVVIHHVHLWMTMALSWSVLIPINFGPLPATEPCYATETESRNLNDFLIIIDYWTPSSVLVLKAGLEKDDSEAKSKWDTVGAILYSTVQFYLETSNVLIWNWEAAKLVQETTFREANSDTVKVSFSETLLLENLLLSPPKPTLLGCMQVKFKILLTLWPDCGW